MSITGVQMRTSFNLAAHRPVGWREARFLNQYDHQLRYGFAPALVSDVIPEKRGTIVLTHGYGEFIDQYYLITRTFQEQGYDVWAMDHYGFGKSGRDDPDRPHRPSTKGMLRHVNDLEFFVQNVVDRAPGKPMVLATNSMGGHIGILHLERHPGVFDGAIMSTPFFDIFRFGLPVKFRPAIQGLFNVLSKIGFRDSLVPATPSMWDKINRVSNAIADNEELREVFKSLAEDAMSHIRVDRPTIGWVASTFPTTNHIMQPETMARIKVPVLIGSVGNESLVDNEAHRLAKQWLPHATLIRFRTAQHNLWFSDNGNYKKWSRSIAAFLNKVDMMFSMNIDVVPCIDACAATREGAACSSSAAMAQAAVLSAFSAQPHVRKPCSRQEP